MTQLFDINRMKSYSAENRLDRILDAQGDGTGGIELAAAGAAITAVSIADPGVATGTAHGYENGDIVNIVGVGGATEANGIRVVSAKTNDTFALTDLLGDDVAVAGTFDAPGVAFPVLAIKPAAAENFHIHRVHIVAGDSTNPTAGTYLGLAKLAVGLTLAVYQGITLLHTLTATPIRSWNDWGLNAGESVPLQDLSGAHVDALVDWDLTSESGYPLLLSGLDTDSLLLITNDDLSGLVYQRASVQGSK